MNFNDVHLMFGEKLSLFAFHFKSKRARHEIKYFDSLYNEYSFIKKNCLPELNAYKEPSHDGTYSISIQYRRYKIFLRKKRLESLPNWVAITISLASLCAYLVIEFLVR